MFVIRLSIQLSWPHIQHGCHVQGQLQDLQPDEDPLNEPSWAKATQSLETGGARQDLEGLLVEDGPAGQILEVVGVPPV